MKSKTHKKSRLGSAYVLWPLVALQVLSAGFFIWDIGASIFGLRSEPLNWQLRELIEVSAALGLFLGVAMGAALLFSVIRRSQQMELRLRQASGAFAKLLEDRFIEWGLTPAERDVAWFTVKGLSLAEIARLRDTSEGTVKSQSNAIYRKANVTGRAQLVSLFIEDLLEEPPAEELATISDDPAEALTEPPEYRP